MSINIDQNALTFYEVQLFNIPPEGAKSCPLLLDFSLAMEYDINLQNIQSRTFFTMVQSVFVDNSAGVTTVTISIPRTGQSIIVAPGRQGYYPVLCPNPSQLSFLSNGGQICKVWLLNFPVNAHDWPTS